MPDASRLRAVRRIAASDEKSVAAQPGFDPQRFADRMMQICITPEAI
jgi:hypothetical protein